MSNKSQGRTKKSECRLINFYLPEELVPLLDSGVRMEDLDRSKWIRSAIREKLQRAGVNTKIES